MHDSYTINATIIVTVTVTLTLSTFAEFQKEEETGQPPPYPEAVLVMDVVGS